jgi:uncharacterized LabA/DUF88 family protein
MKIAVFIDGGHLRALTKQAGLIYNPDYIEKVALACVNADERALRVLYYDCAPFEGKVTLPISGLEQVFGKSDQWLKELARKDLFAVRLGVLKFRGYKPRRIPLATQQLSDRDFKPDFEQKGVDMRIGLDIAAYSAARSLDRIILLSGDTDCIPAMKQGRKAGIQIILATLPNHRVAPELLEHSDYERKIAWPAP